jgi:hypothetical protein
VPLSNLDIAHSFAARDLLIAHSQLRSRGCQHHRYMEITVTVHLIAAATRIKRTVTLIP